MVTDTGKIFILQKAIVDNNLKLDMKLIYNVNGVQQTPKSNATAFSTPTAIGGGTVTTDLVSDEEFTFADTSPVTTFVTAVQLEYDSTTTVASATLTTDNTFVYGGKLNFTAFAIGLT